MAKLKTGDVAPRLHAKSINGDMVDLKSFSDSYLLIAFLRYSECPWCNLALHRLAMEKTLLQESDCRIITFIQSTPEDIKKSILEKHAVKPDFDIVADPAMKIYKQFGVSVSVASGLKHHFRHLPSWVESVRKEKFNQHSINGNFFIAPAAILISPVGQKVVLANYEADFYEHESFSKIYDAIAEDRLYGSTQAAID